ncbi:MAG TPA: hypothetical protein VGI10_01410 [Polyangiaceae bacterium]
MLRSHATLLALTFALVSCGSRALDLDGQVGAQPIVTASTDPQVFANLQEGVAQIAVDGERLYWAGWGQKDATSWALRSCGKQSCASDVITYSATQNEPVSGPFALQGGEIFWLAYLAGMPHVVDILACPVSGCVGQPRLLVGNSNAMSLTVDEVNAFYAAGSDTSSVQIYRVPLAGGSPPAALAALSRGDVYELAMHGDYLYWTFTTSSPSGLGDIQRIRKDGTAAVETLLSNQVAPTSLAFDDNYLYWSKYSDVGALYRWPVSGAAIAPESLVGAVRSPSAVVVDGGQVYFAYELDAFDAAFTHCPVAGCNGFQALAHDLEAGLAIDDRYVYTALTNQALDSSDFRSRPTVQIHRFEK